MTLYERNSPSVVSISVSSTFGKSKSRADGEDGGPDAKEMEEFFRKYLASAVKVAKAAHRVICVVKVVVRGSLFLPMARSSLTVMWSKTPTKSS